MLLLFIFRPILPYQTASNQAENPSTNLVPRPISILCSPADSRFKQIQLQACQLCEEILNSLMNLVPSQDNVGFCQSWGTWGNISYLLNFEQCNRKTFMIHQTFVWWALYILFKFVKFLIRHLGLAIGNVRCVWWFSWTLFWALKNCHW